LDEQPHVQQMTVSGIIERMESLPAKTCLLGQCSDDAPFLFDLSNPETGSLLLVGDPGCGKTHHLQAVVESVIYLNAPHEVQVAVLTGDTTQWRVLVENPGHARYLMGVYSWYDQAAATLIEQLVHLGENRSNGRLNGPTVLLILDDLAGIFDATLETQNWLRWLLVDGPFTGIRPVGSLDSRMCADNPFWVDTFRTFLIGNVAVNDAIHGLGFNPEPEGTNLEAGLEFSAFTGQEWMTYRLPALDELKD
jgi:hypothetical protein